MKVQIYAGALAGACERYRAAVIKELMLPYAMTITTGLWWWKNTEIHQLSRSKEEADIWAKANNPLYWKAQILMAIAKHKRAETLLETTNEELSAIATWLSEHESERI